MSFKFRSILLVIVVFAFLTRIFNLQYPENYYFDEVYHAMTAKLVARNDPRAFEWTHGDTIEPNTYVEWLHPPMAKYAQASMMRLLGENAVGWRMSSVLFGVGVVVFTALLAHRLFANPWVTVLAGGLAALDGLLLTQSRIAMNDIHVVFGFLVSLYAYVWYRHSPRYWRMLIVGCAIGLTIATKWSGAFVWATILFFESTAVIWQSVMYWKSHHNEWKKIGLSFLQQTIIRIAALIILPLLVYVLSYSQMFIQGKPWSHFLELHHQIFWYQFNLEATHPYQSRSYEWILDMSPVWYFVEYLPNNRRADIYNTGNPIIFWSGLAAVLATILILPTLLITNIRQQWNTNLHSPVLSPLKASRNKQLSLSIILVAYLLCWVPWLFSPRIMFSYHYAPAVPFMTILIAYWCNLAWQWSENQSNFILKTVRFVLLFLLLVTIGFFIVWYPHWVAIPVRNTLKDTLYFAMPTWR